MGVIDSVDTVNVGIDNTDITVFGQDNVPDKSDYSSNRYSNGIYAIWNNNGYVIAAVVVGEDTAATTNLFYALKDVNYEEYSDGIWYWSVEGILNGKETTIRERGDWGDLKELENVEKGDVFTVGFDSDGYVVKTSDKMTASADLSDISKLPITGKRTLYLTPAVNTTFNLTMRGWTLYLTTHATEGIRVKTDSPTALVELQKSGSYETNYYSNVDSALKSMQSTQSFDGYLIATIEDRAITSLVIVDTRAQGFDPGPSTSYPTTVVSISPDDQEIIVNARPNATDKTSAIIKALTNAGYTDLSFTDSNKVSATKDGVTIQFTITVQYIYEVTLELTEDIKSVVMNGTTLKSGAKVYAGRKSEGNGATVTVTPESGKNVTADTTGPQFLMDQDGNNWIIYATADGKLKIEAE